MRKPQCSVSDRSDDNYGPSSRASSLLQMWRELESDHVVTHRHVQLGQRSIQPKAEDFNDDSMSMYMSEGPRSENGDSFGDVNEVESESNSFCRYQMRMQYDHEDGNTSGSEQSAAFGESEKKRVRQVFQDWINNGGRSHASNVSHIKNHSSAPLLGENECKRVRMVREWVRRTTQQRGTDGDCREAHATEIGSPIEQVCVGLVANHYEIGTRRAVCRLYGRQSLLDLLTRAERERKIELQGLLQCRHVSNFSHRNRIQSLLRGRFLHNNRIIEDKKPASLAASELGLLRERHTVSDLREGFISRLDNVFLGSVTRSQFVASSNNDVTDHIEEQSEADKSLKPMDESCDRYELDKGERVVNGFCAGNPENNTSINVYQHNFTAQMDETHDEYLKSDEGEQQQISNIDYSQRRNDARFEFVGKLPGSKVYESSEGALVNEHFHLVEPDEVFQEHCQPDGGKNDVQMVSGHTTGLVGNTTKGFKWQDTSVHVEEWNESENEETDWQHVADVEFSEWANSTAEGDDGDWQESTVNRWHHDTLGKDHREQYQLQVLEEWQENGLEEDNWLDEPSGQRLVPVRSVDSFLFPDDDNESNTELRELLRRRRVSSLLESGFRERLDQLLQSCIQRQSNSSFDWELDSTSTSAELVEQDQELQNGNQNEDHSDVFQSNPIGLPLPPVTSSQPRWGEESNDANWPPHNSHQCSAIEWEIVNDLRLNMASLQQRMNNMQRMLEACMDMQVELQRSMRQDVSAGLNISAANKTDVEYTFFPKDESKWDNVRKGICCVCCDSNIDTLLYRCGHMCACSKCAEKLVQGKGKCPMCWSPVAEVIRAYMIH